MAEPVLWQECVWGVAEFETTVAIELPPGADLSKLVRETDPSIRVRARAEFRTDRGLAEWAARLLD